jgi:nitrogen-specific signal transduction histidine kinase
VRGDTLAFVGRPGSAEGWGIGLYVCRALVAKHGGRIEVASGDGRTTFRVVLPIRSAR